MKKDLKVGVVIADDLEYYPLEEYCLSLGGEKLRLLNRDAVRCVLQGDERKLEFVAVFSGTGLVNAATLTTHLADLGYTDIMVNCGLSGGLKTSDISSIVVGSGFVQHDFDLTPIGYKPGVKPNGQTYFFNADERLVNDFTAKFNCDSGVLASGDCFVSDSAKADFIRDNWNAVACDLETAAIASVCYDFGIPFLCFRKISDSADDAANDSYNSFKVDKQNWMTMAIKWLESIVDSDLF